MLEQIWIIPAITFVSFWLILFFGRRLKFGGSEIGLVAVGACLVLSSVAGYQWIRRPVDHEVDWITIGGKDIKASTHVDGLAIVMLFTVSVISFLVHVFS